MEWGASSACILDQYFDLILRRFFLILGQNSSLCQDCGYALIDTFWDCTGFQSHNMLVSAEELEGECMGNTFLL